MKPRDVPPLPPEVEARLDEQPIHERRSIETVWRLLEHASDAQPAAPASAANWERLFSRLDHPPTRRADRPPIARGAASHRRRSSGLRRTLLLGAAVVILAVVVTAVWRTPVRIDVPPGQRHTVGLTDGTRVELNSSTELRLARRFEAVPFLPAPERVVHLQGEAYFDVAETGRPFVVVTPDARIEVLGTEFNVRTRQEGLRHQTSVTLATGRVRISSRRSDDPGVVLSESGQAVHLRDDGGIEQAAERVGNLDVALAWRQDGFSVRNRPLASILAEIERRYALSIRVHPDVSLDDTLTLIYMSPPYPEEILDDICLNQDCRYRKTATGFELFPPLAAPAE